MAPGKTRRENQTSQRGQRGGQRNSPDAKALGLVAGPCHINGEGAGQGKVCLYKVAPGRQVREVPATCTPCLVGLRVAQVVHWALPQARASEVGRGRPTDQSLCLAYKGQEDPSPQAIGPWKCPCPSPQKGQAGRPGEKNLLGCVSAWVEAEIQAPRAQKRDPGPQRIPL